MSTLKTDYKQDILAPSMDGKRKFNLVDSEGNTVVSNVHIEDVSSYSQVGDEFNADVINGQNEAINKNASDISEINTHLRAKAEFSLDGWGSVAGDNYVDLTRAINIPTGYVVDSVEFMSNASCYMSTYFVNASNEVVLRVWNSTATAHGFDVNDKLIVHYK